MGIFNYIPETNHVSRVHSVAAVLYLQFLLHEMLFRPWNMFIIIIIIIISSLLFTSSQTILLHPPPLRDLYTITTAEYPFQVLQAPLP